MPQSATHITVVERVANSNDTIKRLLGDPFAKPESVEGLKMRYAKLGSLGPDIFYGLADFQPGYDIKQDYVNFLIKVAGTFDMIGSVTGDINRYISGVEDVMSGGIIPALKATITNIKGALNEGVLAMMVGPAGMNFFPLVQASRQRDEPRELWFWADYLHYIKTGAFTLKLIENAKKKKNPNLLAYAYGYLTHYVTDVVGHPYVNQVVQGPWRLYWQRHHLVENFIDAYVWDKWHFAAEPKPIPTTEEEDLDILKTAEGTYKPAPVTSSRLHDHVNVGSLRVDDPVDKLVKKVSDKIRNGLFEIGIAEDVTPEMPTDNDFKLWCQLMADTIREVYNITEPTPSIIRHRVPTNLKANDPRRFDGYPTAEDVGAAYGSFRLLLRMGTEKKIKEPVAPDFVGDISASVKRLLDGLKTNISNFPPIPNINSSGNSRPKSFSWQNLLNAIKKLAEWMGEVLVAIVKTVFDFITNLTGVISIIGYPIKYALYLLNKCLYSVYCAFEDVLIHTGYTMPSTDKLAVSYGGGLTLDNLRSIRFKGPISKDNLIPFSFGGPYNSVALWCTPGNPLSNYPVETIHEEVKQILSNYAPFVPPIEQAVSKDVQSPGGYISEKPSFNFIAPYVPPQNNLLTPDAFLETGPTTQEDMFVPAALQQAIVGPAMPGILQPTAIAARFKYFGGAIENSIKGILYATADFKPGIQIGKLVVPPGATLPDYNLDGDRTYGWPCWDVQDQPKEGSKTGSSTNLNPNFPNDPLIIPNRNNPGLPASKVSTVSVKIVND